MSRILLHRDATTSQYVRPDEDGFTTETYFYDTQHVLDANAARRSIDPKPRAYTSEGVCWRQVGSIPEELMHRWYMELGYWPPRDFIMEKLKNPDYRKLLVTEERF